MCISLQISPFKLVILAFLFVTLSCTKEDEVYLTETVEPLPNSGVEVQDFMWKAMNFWYFWQADVANLADDKFAKNPEGSQLYTEFLSSDDDPGAFFENQLQFSEDRFSFYNDDYVELTQSLAGISKSNGLEFSLVRVQDSDAVYGLVRYIVPNSDAATADINRGAIFSAVNGQALFSQRSNTSNNNLNLLFGQADTYTLNMADLVDGVPEPNGKEVTLTKQEGLNENPIFLNQILEIGNDRVGYLVYNGFTNEYDEELNNVFESFQAAAVTDLVVDLRYNPGGSVNTAVLLSSMIYGTNTKDVFLTARYNQKYEAVLEENKTDVRRYFADKTRNGTTLASLNLKKVYIITSGSSASASELVINGLEPYMDVIQIGDVTRGKNEFSVTMVDDRENNYIYSASRVDKIKRGNTWAIQPLLGRNENADGFSNYTSGLIPDETLKEDPSNMGILGQADEPLLALALQMITGTGTAKKAYADATKLDLVTDSKRHTLIGENMYVTELPALFSN